MLDNVYKHKTTLHHSLSQTLSKGDSYCDKSLEESFENCKVVYSIKMDGGASSVIRKPNNELHINLRSADNTDRNDKKTEWLWRYFTLLKDKLPVNWRFSGEVLKWRHSIAYNELVSFFNLYLIWNDKNECLSHEDTMEWIKLLDIPEIGIYNMETVPILYVGKYDKQLLKNMFDEIVNKGNEGIVIRKAHSFTYTDNWYYEDLLKLVRKNHVQTLGKTSC